MSVALALIFCNASSSSFYRSRFVLLDGWAGVLVRGKLSRSSVRRPIAVAYLQSIEIGEP